MKTIPTEKEKTKKEKALAFLAYTNSIVFAVSILVYGYNVAHAKITSEEVQEITKENVNLENFNTFVEQETQKVLALPEQQAYCENQARFVVYTTLEAKLYDLQQELTIIK